MAKTKLTLWDKVTRIVDVEGCSYLEAIVKYSDENKITPRKMARLLCKRLRAAIEKEVKNGNLVRREILEKYFSNKT